MLFLPISSLMTLISWLSDIPLYIRTTTSLEKEKTGSLSSGEEESDTEEPDKKTVAEGKEEEAADEEAEMEKKVAELKAEEVAELKRYVRLRTCLK